MFDFLRFKEVLDKKSFEICNPKLDKIIKGYDFILICNTIDHVLNPTIFQNFKESKIALINQCREKNRSSNETFFILCFKNTIILFSHTSINSLENLFISNSNLSIYYLRDTNDIFTENAKIQNKRYNSDNVLNEEISSFSKILKIHKFSEPSLKEIWKFIQPCISGYLIKQAYEKLNENRLSLFSNYNENIKNYSSDENWDTNEYIELRSIAITFSSIVVLIYQIEKEELFVIKKPITNDAESPKLKKRELENYSKLNYPLLPKFFGTIKKSNFIIIEYINGSTLLNIQQLHLDESEKITIIFELVITILYLHENKFIFRDLKPNNVIIDQFKTAVLIDFDRMINTSKDEEHTQNLSSSFVAPENNLGEPFYKSDIYSLGKLIYYIMNEKEPENQKFEPKTKIEQISEKCMNLNAAKRPSLYEIIFEIFTNYGSHINPSLLQYNSHLNFILGSLYMSSEFGPIDTNKAIHYYSLSADQNNINAQYNLGAIYYSGKIIKKDMNKAIHYLTLAAEQNHSEAQLKLGTIYHSDEFVMRNINKAINYYSLAANQNNADAQFNLGIIYYSGIYISRDINKAIHYLSLAANQNHTEAQFILGSIYDSCELEKRDINKAIYYLSLAANKNYAEAQFILGEIYTFININEAINYYQLASNQNHIDSLFNLGLIYFTGEHIVPDINKSIHYFTLAAQQNHSDSQFYLGLIYFQGNYFESDINKAIYYFTLSANQGNVNAQYNLGIMYYSNEFIARDINKAIYFFELSANQNLVDSQFNLGVIYYSNDFITQDINKAIHYLTLAADQNFLDAQLMLGEIYDTGKYIERNLKKAIYFYKLAAEQNNSDAQYNLGLIYISENSDIQDINKGIHYISIAANQNHSESLNLLGEFHDSGKYFKQDINKSIYYYTLAANQNNVNAQFNLGKIYFNNKLFNFDINKAIHYFTLAANQNHIESLFNLGIIYCSNIYDKQNINKSIYYLSLASNKSHPKAQYYIGMFYLKGLFVEQYFKKGFYLISLSSTNKCIEAHFALGFLYHEGKYIQRDIEKAIHYYKEASSFNNQYAKNNLGIIFKNGFGEKVPQKIESAIVYFEEAIQQKNDEICMYNLAHLYFYEKPIKNSIDESIKLLIKSSKFNFFPSKHLLCLVLLKKYRNNVDKIKERFENESKNLIFSICKMIKQQKLNNSKNYEDQFEHYKTINYIYDDLFKAVISTVINNNDKLQKENQTIKDITKNFYDGFGIF